MGSKSNHYDEELSNGESSRGNDTSLIVNVNDTQSDIEESNYSHSDNENGLDQSSDSIKKEKPPKGYSSKKSKNENSIKRKSPARDPKIRQKVDSSKTRYIWASGIPQGTKTSQLEELFAQHGNVLAIKIIRGSGTTLLGFVKLETFEQAQKCMDKLNQTEFRGNKMDLFKERPIDKDEKKPEKIGFRDNRKFIPRPAPVSRPHFRSPPRGNFRGSSKPMPSRDHARLNDLRRQEREELFQLEREKQRLKLERLKFERDKAELFKIERESRNYERERIHEDKRPVRSLVKRPMEDTFLDEKRFDDYNRREDFTRRFDSRGSPDRKINSGRSFAPVSSRGRYEDNSRQERFPDKYEAKSSWPPIAEASSWVSNDRWQSSSYDSPRIMPSSISSSITRIHSSSELPQSMSSRSYFSNNRRY